MKGLRTLPDLHKLNGEKTDVYRIAFNLENKLDTLRTTAEDLFQLLQEAQYHVNNPSLMGRIQEAIEKYGEPL